ncbi:competence type IV pilus ATPase ComGA [Vagococcus xieshaowenii]|uniref:competence type IV pilus ATPase ComGA n=1 Tax=Vagococcus xieshaowenii TaxID=2562451 RepID=UPI0014324993|nr:competence type IV pilus ATPase ComGA [Vagococcus xieshaowenii]
MKQLMRELFDQALAHHASDLYIFPTEESYECTLRYQNKKKIIKQLPLGEGEKFILFLKYLGNMDVGEKRKIQLGSAIVELKDNKELAIRLSSVADYQNRETLVIRFIGNIENQDSFNLINTSSYIQIQDSLTQKGLFIFSGATGSGKTTMMYRLANHCAKKGEQIITIEDPVEFSMSNFLQLQVNEKIDLSYQRLIQLCLRHRPDVLVIGEIRDSETAHAVVRAALTGHTVLTTVHAMDALNVISRLVELGVSIHELKQVLQMVAYLDMRVFEGNEQVATHHQAVHIETLHMTKRFWDKWEGERSN